MTESGVEPGLGAGIEDTYEPVRLQWAAVQESDLPGHESRGIESASPKAPGVERHWDDPIRRQDRGSPSRCPGQPARASSGSGVESCQAARRVLEAVNPSSPLAPHGDCGDDRSEPRIGWLGKGNRGQPGKRRLAAWAKNFSRARSSAAGAVAGQKKIKQVVRIQREGLRGTGPDRTGACGLVIGTCDWCLCLVLVLVTGACGLVNERGLSASGCFRGIVEIDQGRVAP